MTENIIEVNGISKSFGDHLVLNSVDIKFEKNKIHGIVGRNGSGKTVLMKIICGFMSQDSGSVSIGGKLVKSKSKLPMSIGIIIESPGFLPNLSGYNNLKFLASIRNKLSRKDIEDVMVRVNLDPHNKKWVSKYSLGMKQRLGIAQAIMESPDILILDEPMNGLDKTGVEEVRTLLMNLRDEGKTIIIASHNSEDIDILCDTVCEMDGGLLEVIR